MHPFTKPHHDSFQTQVKSHHSSPPSHSEFLLYILHALASALSFYFWGCQVGTLPCLSSQPAFQPSDHSPKAEARHAVLRGWFQGSLGNFIPPQTTPHPLEPSWHPSGSHSPLLTAMPGYQVQPCGLSSAMAHGQNKHWRAGEECQPQAGGNSGSFKFPSEPSTGWALEKQLTMMQTQLQTEEIRSLWCFQYLWLLHTLPIHSLSMSLDS